MVRSAGAVLGWLILSITPNTDRLSTNLARTDDTLFEGEQQTLEQVQWEAVRSSGV